MDSLGGGGPDWDAQQCLSVMMMVIIIITAIKINHEGRTHKPIFNYSANGCHIKLGKSVQCMNQLYTTEEVITNESSTVCLTWAFLCPHPD